MQPVHNTWLVFLLPLLVVHGAWLWSSVAGAIDWCLPYWSGCTSISKAARSSDALFLFRAVMTFNAALLANYWLHASRFLTLYAAPKSATCTLNIIGITGAIFLVLYANFLGSDGSFYQLLRRYGVTIYFSFTVLAQMLFLRQLILRIPINSRWIKYKTRLSIGLLFLGLASVFCNALLSGTAKDTWENIIEWHFALGMNFYFLFSALLWQNAGYSLQARTTVTAPK
ncbi:hypothetical protein [Cellvibrio mixtus]|uniref:hypothetical protein n=1 Tax=Cellvibrio mixtus TaxID=39650 RepID=UPI00058664C6|nr:hypothetical protein [Cellvibrio mixtus]